MSYGSIEDYVHYKEQFVVMGMVIIVLYVYC